ncbi:glycosyltransferase [Fidelibacter multiformis]|uniref:glycosyltransferase n=1 Tax=Fidelibacter multiformis TaxID=3377529 RepID=UPI0037DCA33D
MKNTDIRYYSKDDWSFYIFVNTELSIKLQKRKRKENNGILVDEKNPKAIANAVINIVENTYFRKKLIERGLEDVVKRYSWDSIAKKYNDYYNNITRSHSWDKHIEE